MTSGRQESDGQGGAHAQLREQGHPLAGAGATRTTHVCCPGATPACLQELWHEMPRNLSRLMAKAQRAER